MRRHHASRGDSSSRVNLTPPRNAGLPLTSKNDPLLDLPPAGRGRLFRRGFFSRSDAIAVAMAHRGGLSFIVFGIIVIVGIHLYLFHVLVNSSESSTTVPRVARTTATLQALRPIDYEKYTIRINTWHRNHQLIASVMHHASCPGVAQIQVVWCDPDADPPPELNSIPGVVVERHSVNSLNERFHIKKEPPTLGILSMDDDVLRPCNAIDAGFFRWSRHPERMVGFDARTHVESIRDDDTWSYGYLSTTEKSNRYSMSLPRYAFLHRDYLKSYYRDLPRSIFDSVATNFNCEDIAMSFWVSSHTGGKPPLLVDYWAMSSMIKLYSPERISGQSNHKHLRDDCVNTFSEQLQLKRGENKLKHADVVHKHQKVYAAGDVVDDVDGLDIPHIDRYDVLQDEIHKWKHLSPEEFARAHARMKIEATLYAYPQGLIEGSKPWKKRWGKKR